MTEHDSATLRPLVEAWSASASSVLDLLTTLSEDDFATATDLPGWTVRDIVAHLAHLESELAGGEPVLADESEIPADARDDAFRSYTERGVAARRSRSTAELLAELTSAVDRLRTTLDAPEPPAPPASFPRPGRTWEPLLRDRTFDFWMHEQDIRRALDREGGWDSPGALLSIATLRAAIPYVVGKKVRPPAGSTIAITIEGTDWADTVTVNVGDDGRAREVAAGAEAPDAGLTMTAQDFVLAGGGRRDPATLEVEVTGDTDLARRVLTSLAVTP